MAAQVTGGSNYRLERDTAGGDSHTAIGGTNAAAGGLWKVGTTRFTVTGGPVVSVAEATTLDPTAFRAFLGGRDRDLDDLWLVWDAVLGAVGAPGVPMENEGQAVRRPGG